MLACSGLALFGIIGEDKGDERFEAKQVTVTPTGDDGLTIREVVDQDFGGSRDSHGYQRIIPNDFGVPTDVTATSPDAPADVSVTQVGGETRIRVGDPDQTVSGQHRYVLTYTLPDARLSSGELALDVIGNDETLETGRFEVVVTGLQLDDPLCNVGGFGTSGGCTLEPDGAVYRAVVSPLEPGDGITIGGTINGRTDAVAVPEPGLPARRGDNRIPMALAVLAVGTAGASGTYLWARRRGRNEVFAGGAADAAFGAPPPGSALPPPGPGATVSLVADERMDDLATTEFVPPQGLEPWQGTVLLRERIDNESVGAWFSGLAARDVITLTRTDDDEVTLGVGEQFETDVEHGRRSAAGRAGRTAVRARAGRPRSGRAAGTSSASSSRFSRPPATRPRRKPPLRAGGGVDAERAVALGSFGEARRDDREAGRRGERRGGALEEARQHEQRAVAGEAAERRCDSEDRKRYQQHPAPAEQVGGAAAQQQEAAVAEHVAGNDPLEA